MTWDFSTDADFQRELDWMLTFVKEEVEPLDLLFRGPADPFDPNGPARPIIKSLQKHVHARDLWAAHLGPELGGKGMGQVKLGLMNEILGRSRFAPVVFGTQRPIRVMPKSSPVSAPRNRSAAICNPCSMAISSRAIR